MLSSQRSPSSSTPRLMSILLCQLPPNKPSMVVPLVRVSSPCRQMGGQEVGGGREGGREGKREGGKEGGRRKGGRRKGGRSKGEEGWRDCNQSLIHKVLNTSLIAGCSQLQPWSGNVQRVLITSVLSATNVCSITVRWRTLSLVPRPLPRFYLAAVEKNRVKIWAEAWERG